LALRRSGEPCGSDPPESETNDNIEDYYKNIDKPIINNCINNLNLKNLLKLSTVVDLYLFTKKKNKKFIRKIENYNLKKFDDKSTREDINGFDLRGGQMNEINLELFPDLPSLALCRLEEPCGSDRICKDKFLSDTTVVTNGKVSDFSIRAAPLRSVDPPVIYTKNENTQTNRNASEDVKLFSGAQAKENTTIHEFGQHIEINNNNLEAQMDKLQINKFTWKLKDKRELLKECEYKRKKMIKEVSSSLNILSKSKKSSKLVNEIKIKNNNILNNIENIDSIIETIENNYPTLSDDFIEIYSN